MPHINNMELQNIRELIGAEMLSVNKSNVFAQQVNDPQLRAYLQKKAQGTQQNIQLLSQFLVDQTW